MSTLTQLDPQTAAQLFFAGHPLAFVDEPGAPFVCGQWMGRLAYVTPMPFDPDQDAAADYFTTNPVIMAGTAIDTPADPGAPPTNIDVPYVVQLGQGAVDDLGEWHDTLTSTEGNWQDPQPRNFMYQWQRDGVTVAVSGATYQVGTTDEGHTFVCIVTAFNAYGATPATSNEVVVTGP